MKADDLLAMKPFDKTSSERQGIFFECVKEALKAHYEGSEDFKKFCNSQKFDPYGNYSYEDIPFMPVSIFKKVNLTSVPEEKIERKVISSSTSGNSPSVISLDKVTINRQIKAIGQIMGDFLGTNRRVFVVFDSEKTVKARGGELSSRGSAIRGMFPFAKSVKYVLDEDLNLDRVKFRNILNSLVEEEVCFFGFTWLMYKTISENKEFFEQKIDWLKNPLILHIGGWKKLKDKGVSKDEFNRLVAKSFHSDSDKVRDFYGMTEQLGTIYIDCEKGYKHVPIYSDVLIRDVNDFSLKKNGEKGFIQLVSPLPNSYPGVSILTDDVGAIVGEDDCECGRKGKYFLFKERFKKAEVKGCGDALGG